MRYKQKKNLTISKNMAKHLFLHSIKRFGFKCALLYCYFCSVD